MPSIIRSINSFIAMRSILEGSCSQFRFSRPAVRVNNTKLASRFSAHWKQVVLGCSRRSVLLWLARILHLLWGDHSRPSNFYRLQRILFKVWKWQGNYQILDMPWSIFCWFVFSSICSSFPHSEDDYGENERSWYHATPGMGYGSIFNKLVTACRGVWCLSSNALLVLS